MAIILKAEWSLLSEFKRKWVHFGVLFSFG